MKKQIIAAATLAAFIGSASAEVATSSMMVNGTSTPAMRMPNCGMGTFVRQLKLGDGKRNGLHSEVRELQDKLIEDGYLKASSTGLFGPATMKAVKEYQKYNNISSTGSMGPKTLAHMKKHFCEDAREMRKDMREEMKDAREEMKDKMKDMWDNFKASTTKATTSTSN